MIKNYQTKLENFRKKIDLVDQLLINSLKKRFELVKKIGRLKKEIGLPALDKKRWQEVLRSRIKKASELGLSKKLIKKIYEIIHDYALEIEEKQIKKTKREKLIFGIQGGKGSFNEQAILTYIKNKKIKNFKIKYLYTTKNVLKSLVKKNIDFGLFAIFNSKGGIVEQSLNVLGDYQFKIIDKITISINHFLMKRKDVKKNEIKQIMAHPQVFLQCKNNLKTKYPDLKLVSGKGKLIDTASAAKALFLKKIDKNTAILGPRILSEMYDFEIIDENLQDDENNRTTFLLVSR